MKYIKPNNLPPKISVIVPAFWWLFLDRLAAPGWLMGVVFALLSLMYVAELAKLVGGEAVDVVGNDD